MDDAGAFSSGLRVVVLCRSADPAGPALDGSGAPGLRCVRASSAYEATAELLAAPVDALVIDLRLMTPRHVRLIEIAREMDVEMFAVGALPMGMNADDLSGLRLLARDELPAALERLAAPAEASARAPQAHTEAPGAQAKPVELAPAKLPKKRRPVEPAARKGIPVPAEGEEPPPPTRAGPAAEAPEGEGKDVREMRTLTADEVAALLGESAELLTPEELAALLEKNS